MIQVTKTFLPDFELYTSILKRAWNKAWLTNNGELVQELETRLQEFLGVKYLLYCSNGTVVLQMALRALNISKEVITTPFSYVATTGSLLWEHCTPVFADIDPSTFCINPVEIEKKITENTQAIMATHVYGMPCNLEAIREVGVKYNLKIIYDGAHAFGCSFNNQSLLSFGDVSTCSFHATKLFHTVEGGVIICNDEPTYKKLIPYRSFGHIGDDYYSEGINAKNSEFHAAMGLAVLPSITSIISRRKELFEYYQLLLKNTSLRLIYSEPISGFNWNYSYFPVLFCSESELIRVKEILQREGVSCRRYFYPSLNQLPFLSQTNHCPISEELSLRVLCLPLYFDLEKEDIYKISTLIKSAL